jgi:hypothetical protein
MNKQPPQTLVHYDRPVSHSQTETRFLIPKFTKKLSKTMKLLDIVVQPDVPCYWSALAGAYNVVGRMQIRVAGVEASFYYSPEVMSFLLPSAGSNDVQKCLYSQVHATSNNVVYNANQKRLELQQQAVDFNPAEIRLAVLSNFLASIGCIEDDVEIIINWNADFKKYLIPIDENDTLTSINIQMPYLSYETYEHSNMKQPEKFLYTEIVGEQILIPEIVGNNTSQLVSRLTTAFNEKTIKRILFQNIPQSLETYSPLKDTKALYKIFGSYLSVPQINEIINFIENGESVLTNRGVQNDAIKLATTVDSFGVNACIVSGAHTHLKQSQLFELDKVILNESAKQLNGFFSWGCVNLNKKIQNNFQITYQRTSAPDATLYPTLSDNLIIGCYGECQVAWVDNQKVYV